MDCWITIFNHDQIKQTEEEEESSKSKSNSKSILVVAHNAVIQALVATALGSPNLAGFFFRKVAKLFPRLVFWQGLNVFGGLETRRFGMEDGHGRTVAQTRTW